MTFSRIDEQWLQKYESYDNALEGLCQSSALWETVPVSEESHVAVLLANFNRMPLPDRDTLFDSRRTSMPPKVQPSAFGLIKRSFLRVFGFLAAIEQEPSSLYLLLAVHAPFDSCGRMQQVLSLPWKPLRLTQQVVAFGLDTFAFVSNFDTTRPTAIRSLSICPLPY